jgi:hypothetical protein
MVEGHRRTRLADLLPGLDQWLPMVRRLRPAQSWGDLAAAVNAALPAGRRRFTRDRLVQCVRMLVNEGLTERHLLEAARPRSRRRKSEAVRAADAVAYYLRSHRREAAERDVLPEASRPPTLAQIGKHLTHDAKIKTLDIKPPSSAAWVLSSLKALVDRARSAGQV